MCCIHMKDVGVKMGYIFLITWLLYWIRILQSYINLYNTCETPFPACLHKHEVRIPTTMVHLHSISITINIKDETFQWCKIL